MNNLMQVQSRTASGATYADPSNPECTVKIKTSVGKKTLQGNTVPNYITEVIFNDQIPVTVNGVTTNDFVSVRVRISTDKASMGRVKELAQSLTAQLPGWLDRNVALGFELDSPPQTIPRLANKPESVASGT